MLPSIHGFWFGNVLNRCYGNDIYNAHSNELAHRISVFVSVVVGRNAEHIPIHVIEAVLKRGIRLVRPALNRPEQGHFLFKFLSIGWEQQNGVMVRFAQGRALYGSRKLE